ncbi:MAG: site-specific DNA-methyltransferase [Bdellovibrionales bacterium]|jgi:DNA modification methylase|nr:site-specific DNA-methyltransferase [Bdellovibrionales bacterium]
MKNQNTKSENLTLHIGDNLKSLAQYKDNSIDAVIIDGPYGLNSKEPDIQKMLEQFKVGQNYILGGKGMANKKWDSDLPNLHLCRELLRVLKPGGYLAGFAGSRTYDILVITLRWAGFLIKDQMIWAYASGVPKQGKVEVEDDESTASGSLKPAFEPIVIAQKPITEKDIEANMKKYSTGAFNVDAVRVVGHSDGKERYPANIVTDGSKAIEAGFHGGKDYFNSCPYSYIDCVLNPILYYSKAGEKDREFGLDKYETTEFRRSVIGKKILVGQKNLHETVKPIALMCHLVRLFTQPGGTVLDCFMGSGSTGISTLLEGRKFVGMELDPKYFRIASERIDRTQELIEQFKVSDHKLLSHYAALDSLKKDIKKAAALVLKEPKNTEYRADFERLIECQSVCEQKLKKQLKENKAA